MYRINIEPRLLSDARFIRLQVLCKSPHKAWGTYMMAVIEAQHAWSKGSEIISEKVLKKIPLWENLIESELITRREGGYYLAGSEEQFSWIKERKKAAKKGGEKNKKRIELNQEHSQSQTIAKEEPSDSQEGAKGEPSISISISNSISNSKKNKKNILSGKPDELDNFVIQSIAYLNQVRGTEFKHETKATRKALAGLKNLGYGLEDVKLVVEHKNNEWQDDEKMRNHLVPTTLFRESNFEKYLEAAKAEQRRKDELKQCDQELLDLVKNGISSPSIYEGIF